MKTISKIIPSFCLLFSLGCYAIGNNIDSQSANQIPSGTSVIIKFTQITSHFARKPNHLVEDSLHLYSEIENRRNLTLSQLEDSLTVIKYFNEKISENQRKIQFYYQKNRIIAIVSRMYNTKDEVIAYEVFYFKENNDCDWYTFRGINEEGSKTYAFLKGLVVCSDASLTPIIMKESKKMKIIQLVKTSIDSTMLHFPEFKYSLNWK
jgi:hypothetical protein